MTDVTLHHILGKLDRSPGPPFLLGGLLTLGPHLRGLFRADARRPNRRARLGFEDQRAGVAGLILFEPVARRKPWRLESAVRLKDDFDGRAPAHSRNNFRPRVITDMTLLDTPASP